MNVKIEKRRFEFKVTDANVVSGDGMMRGYASTFRNVDQGYDVVEEGAFKKTIKEGAKWPILASHLSHELIGFNRRASEDQKGLIVEGKLHIQTNQEALKWFGAMKDALENGSKMGLSIGYSVVKWEPNKENPMIRHLKELKLWEYSVVTFPMNVEAMVTEAKGYSHLTDEEWIRKTREETVRRGWTEQKFIDALAEKQAAEGVFDPAHKNQSIAQAVERAIKIIRGES